MNETLVLRMSILSFATLRSFCVSEVKMWRRYEDMRLKLRNEICECKALIWRIWRGHKLTWGQGRPLYPTNHHVLLSDGSQVKGLEVRVMGSSKWFSKAT